jgi:hypothetical protein
MSKKSTVVLKSSRAISLEILAHYFKTEAIQDPQNCQLYILYSEYIIQSLPAFRRSARNGKVSL